MKSKTLALMSHYYKLLKEQGEDPNQMQGQAPSDQGAPPESVQDVTQPVPEETMPLTSEGEDKYISDLIDAALFEPSAEEANTLLNLQSAMQMKKYTNAREEILPTVLSIISSSTQGGNLKKALNKID